MSKSQPLNQILKQWDKFKQPEVGDKYVHYKGSEYKIVATGFLEDTEAPCVVYQSIERGTVWVRTAKNFLEKVEYKGKVTPRFKRVGK